MRFGNITVNQRALRERASGIRKQAGLISKALTPVTAPLKAMGKGIIGGTWNATKRSAGWNSRLAGGSSSGRLMGKVLAPVMYGAGVVGTGAAAVHGINKYKQYKQGFDPRLQQAQQAQGRYPGNQ